MTLHSRALALVVAASLVIATAAPAQERRAPTVDDLLNLVQVSGAEMSPDGTQVIYIKSELKKWSDNKRVTSIWIANADGTDHREFLSSDKDHAPAWSPDGRHVAFLSTRDQPENSRDAAGAQIWLLRVSGGGEATKLTDLKSAVRALRWSEDSSRIFLTAEEPQTDEQRDTRKNKGDGIFVDEGPNGQGRSAFSNLWVITLTSKESRRLTNGDQIVGDFAPSPDGSQVAYISRPNNQRNQQNRAEVHLVRTASGEVKQLTTNEAPENNIAWLPTGSAVSYVAPHDKSWELDQGNLYVHPIEGGSATVVTASFAGDIGEYFWHPSAKRVVMSAMMKGRGGVYELDLSTGRTRVVTTGDVGLTVSSASKDVTRLAGSRSASSQPGEIAVIDVTRGAASVVTDVNPRFKSLEVAEMRQMTWKSRDGLEIEGRLWLPSSYKAGDKLPTILSIQQGDDSNIAAAWRAGRDLHDWAEHDVLPGTQGSKRHNSLRALSAGAARLP